MDIWTGDLTKKERDTCFVLGPAGRMAASGVFKLANVARRRQRNIYRNVIRKKNTVHNIVCQNVFYNLTYVLL